MRVHEAGAGIVSRLLINYGLEEYSSVAGQRPWPLVDNNS